LKYFFYLRQKSGNLSIIESSIDKGVVMFDFKEIVDKLKDIISAEMGDRKVYDKDIASELNINHLTFATMKNRNKIPYQEVLDFCARKKISINWLLYDQVTESISEETEKYARVRYFRDIYASAGGGADVYDEESEYLSLDDEIVGRLGGNRELRHIEALNVTGDSMEPTLKNGNIIYINRNITDINDHSIFVVATTDGLFIKRIAYNEDEIRLISDNKSYSDISFEPNEVTIVGKVVGVQTFMENY
jgi:SOS-response transcriptional repressor LexA